MIQSSKYPQGVTYVQRARMRDRAKVLVGSRESTLERASSLSALDLRAFEMIRVLKPRSLKTGGLSSTRT
jgi:hypothetical protein